MMYFIYFGLLFYNQYSSVASKSVNGLKSFIWNETKQEYYGNFPLPVEPTVGPLLWRSHSDAMHSDDELLHKPPLYRVRLLN